MKFIIGLILSVLSYVAIDVVTGGIFGRDADTTNLQMTAFIRQKEGASADRLFYRSKITLRDQSNIGYTVSVFDDVLDLGERRRLIKSVESLTLRFNFKPHDIIIPSSKVSLISSIEEKCRSEFEYCLHVDEKTFAESRGHFIIETGLKTSRESFSTSSLKIGMLAGQPETDVEVFLDLPNGWNAKNVSPEADNVSSFASTRLIWEGDNRYGQSLPLPAGGRGIAENVGIELELESSSRKRLETTLLFFLSAIFGVGFTLTSECVLSPFFRARRKGE